MQALEAGVIVLGYWVLVSVNRSRQASGLASLLQCALDGWVSYVWFELKIILLNFLFDYIVVRWCIYW